MKYKFNDVEYELIKNFRDGFDFEETNQRYTEYFDDFDYVFGDWAYGKLRLKGFYDSNNSKVKELNDIKNLENYLNDSCAVGCRHFLLKKNTEKVIQNKVE